MDEKEQHPVEESQGGPAHHDRPDESSTAGTTPEEPHSDSSTHAQQQQQQQRTLAGQVGHGGSNNSSGTFAHESEQMKIFVTNANVTYHTRHARRIYVGGIPPNYSDEEELRNFFNKVIAKGLGVENDHSFVISVYMNQKKCYAFVEFSSIELTTACLDMDGIIFKKVTLKIYRANEYRPELVPHTKFLKLDLSGWSFGLATGAGASNNLNNSLPSMNNSNNNHSYSRTCSNNSLSPVGSWVDQEPVVPTVPLNDCIASLIQFTNIASMEPGSIAIVGFPYESSSTKATTSASLRSTQRGVGTSTAPACLRKCLTSYAGAVICNCELGLDLSLQPIMDVGDVLAGQSRSETKALLSTTVSELLLRGSVPFLIGGSRDQSYYSAMGLVAATGVCVGVINVSAQVDSKILDSSEFCSPASRNLSPNRSHNCFGRYVQFGAQGAQCNSEVARSIVDRGGHIFWLHKDLRSASTESLVVAQFNRALRNLDACVLHDQQRKGLSGAAQRSAYPQAFIMVTIDCGALAAMFNPYAGSSNSSVGLTAEEILELAYIAGAHPNVALLEVTEFRPDADTESRVNMFLADVFYKFTLGVASRTQQLRGGALGAGAVAVTAGVSAAGVSTTGVPGIVPGGVQAQYGGRTPNSQSANIKRTAPVGYASAGADPGSRYIPSRDPAMILQQQQQQQPQQTAVPGRMPYTPQQLQYQQQQHQQMRTISQMQQPMGQSQQQQVRSAVGAFPGIPENGYNNQSGSRIVPQMQRGTVVQSPNLSGSYYSQDDVLGLPGPPDFNLNGSKHSQLAQMSPQSSGYQTGTRAAAHYGSITNDDEMRLKNRPSAIVTQPPSDAGSIPGMYGQQSQFARNQGGTNGSGLLNPGAATFQSENKWAGYGSNAASLGTPNSVGTHNTAVPQFPSSDWIATDASRMSNLSSSTSSMSMSMGSLRPTTSFNLATGQGSNQFSHLSGLGGSFRGSSSGAGNLGDLSSPYDDAMDKLIGVTNIGHIPSFDDPHDPLYQDD